MFRYFIIFTAQLVFLWTAEKVRFQVCYQLENPSMIKFTIKEFCKLIPKIGSKLIVA